MKTFMKKALCTLMVLTIATQLTADYNKTSVVEKKHKTVAYKQNRRGDLAKVTVANHMGPVGAIYVSVKSQQHHTKRVRIVRVLGISRHKDMRFARTGVNTICAYTSKNNPTTRYLYQLELAPDATNNRVALDENELKYTYTASNGLDQTVRIESMQQELIDGQWQDIVNK